MTLKFTLLWMGILTNGYPSLAREWSPEARLFVDLMAKYNKHIRPKLNPNEQLIVQVIFSLKKIENLVGIRNRHSDEKHQVLTSFGWIRLIWKDELLTWDPSQYNGTNRLVLSNEVIWLPEMAMLNRPDGSARTSLITSKITQYREPFIFSVNQGDDLSYDSKFRARVMYDGTIKWSPGFKWETSCQVDLKLFPFDTQICSVKFVNWVYGGFALDYYVRGIFTTVLEENDEWNVTSAFANRTVLYKDKEDNIDVPMMYFTVVLKRNSIYYVTNVLIPCVIISFMSILVFVLPPDAGEKISLSITVSLSYTVLLLIVSDITPKGGTTIPMLTLFIVQNMGQTAASIMMTIWILNIYHTAPCTPIPPWVRTLVFNTLAPILCMCDTRKVQVCPQETRHGQQLDWMVQQNLQLEDIDEKETESVPIPMNYVNLPDDVTACIKSLTAKAEENQQEGNNKADWMRVSRVMDRFFFVLFLFVIIGEVIGFALAVTHGF